MKAPNSRPLPLAAAAVVLLGGMLGVSSTSAASTPEHPNCLGTIGKPKAIPPVTAPLKTAAWFAQYARAERVMNGLNASRFAINRAATSPSSSSAPWGFPTTPAESAEVYSHNDIARIAAELTSAPPDNTFAGAFPDPGNPSQVDIAALKGSCASLQVAQSRFPDAHFVAVRSLGNTPYRTLTKEFARLTVALPSLSNQGIQVDYLSVNVYTDVLDVRIAPSSSPSALPEISKVAGGRGLRVTRNGVLEQSTDARTDPSPSHVYGGQELTDGSSDYVCTTDIALHNGSKYWDLSAGHCFHDTSDDDVGQNQGSYTALVYTPASEIGVVQPSDPTHTGATVTCDCEEDGTQGEMTQSRASHTVLVNSNSTFTFSQWSDHETDDYGVGTTVSMSGVAEYEMFGVIATGKISTDNTGVMQGPPQGQVGPTFQNNDQFLTNYPSGGAHPIGGDSGGVIGSGTLFLGIQSGVNSAGTVGNGSKAEHVFDYYPGATYDAITPD